MERFTAHEFDEPFRWAHGAPVASGTGVFSHALGKQGLALGVHDIVHKDERGAPDFGYPRADMDQIVIPGGPPVAALGFAYGQHDAEAFDLRVTHAHLADVLAAGTFEEVQVFRVIEIPHRIGFSIGDAVGEPNIGSGKIVHEQHPLLKVPQKRGAGTAALAAAVLALVIWYVMQKTSRGYEMKLTGQNERFARFIGIRTDRLVLVCMLLSGALCGLVGMFRVYGAEHLFRDSISRDYYFEGLMVAMIARYQPLAVVFLSLFFAALKIGAQGMELAAGVPNQIYLIIQTVVIFLMAAESGLFGALQNRVRKGKEAEKHA